MVTTIYYKHFTRNDAIHLT